MSKLSHVDSSGQARMVDVGGKLVTERVATATVVVQLNAEAFAAVEEDRIAKGDVLTVAKVAGISAAKKTSELIPLCHQLSLDQVDIRFELHSDTHTIRITATAQATATTGVEMEALTACSVAALTIYDMVKAIQKDMVIQDLQLQKKTGGKSDDFHRADS